MKQYILLFNIKCPGINDSVTKFCVIFLKHDFDYEYNTSLLFLYRNTYRDADEKKQKPAILRMTMLKHW